MGRDTVSVPPSIALNSFNPRARVGRDKGDWSTAWNEASFNPRARVGRDSDFAEQIAEGIGVSIHAPAWGATQTESSGQKLRRCFNPRARVGRDLLMAFWTAAR